MSAAASGVHAGEELLFFTLLQLAVIVLAGGAGGALARRLGQAAVVGEIVVGILLGPSLFGALAPGPFAAVFLSTPPQPLQMLSQLGLLLLMFQVGLEFDFGHLSERRHRRAVFAVSAAGLAAPFALGAAFAAVLPAALRGSEPALVFALFVGTAFSITAMPVLGRILMELQLTRAPLGVIAISAAAVSDVAGWLLLALVTALATAGHVSWGLAGHLLGVLAFAALGWWGVRPPLRAFVRARLARAEGGTLPPALVAVVIAAICLAGMATHRLGIFAVFGAFMVGVLLHQERDFAHAWSSGIGGFVQAFFMPLFFAYTGLRTDLGALDGAAAWGWCAALIALATLGKLGACAWAARRAGLDAPQARVVGLLMNTRGLMELVVVNVGYDLGVIGRELFTMLVLMAIASTVITTPAVRRALRRLQALPGEAVPAGVR